MSRRRYAAWHCLSGPLSYELPDGVVVKQCELSADESVMCTVLTSISSRQFTMNTVDTRSLATISSFTVMADTVHLGATGALLVARSLRNVHKGSDRAPAFIWDTRSGRCVAEIDDGTGLAGVIFCDVERCAVVHREPSGVGRCTLWTAAAGCRRIDLTGHTDTITSCMLWADGLVTTSMDCTARVWDLKSGACLHALRCDQVLLQCCGSASHIVVSGGWTSWVWALGHEDEWTSWVWAPEHKVCLIPGRLPYESRHNRVSGQMVVTQGAPVRAKTITAPNTIHWGAEATDVSLTDLHTGTVRSVQRVTEMVSARLAGTHLTIGSSQGVWVTDCATGRRHVLATPGTDTPLYSVTLADNTRVLLIRKSGLMEVWERTPDARAVMLVTAHARRRGRLVLLNIKW